MQKHIKEKMRCWFNWYMPLSPNPAATMSDIFPNLGDTVP